MPLAAAPQTANMTAYPAAQPASAATAAATRGTAGRAAAADAAGRPGRSGSSPAPWSRRSASAKASPVPAANSASGSASTHQRSPPNGRSVSVQPSGSTQVSQDGPLAPADVADRPGEERDAEHADRQAASGPRARR